MKSLAIVTLCLFTLTAAYGGSSVPEDAAAAWLAVGKQSENELAHAQFAVAAETGKRALRLAKRFGADDVRVGSSHYLLGVIYRDWGRCPEARSNYHSAISIWKRQPEPGTERIFRAVAGLISALTECDDFAAAQKIYKTYEQDLRMGSKAPGDRAQLISLEATIARGRKEYAKAEALFREAIDLLERTPGSSRVELTILRNSRSVALDRLGRYEEAYAEANEAAVFFEPMKALHPSYVAALNNAACALAALNRREESERLFEGALRAATALYGEENQIVAKIMLSYARVLRENKEEPAAALWRQRGVDAYQRSLVRNRQTVDVQDLKLR